MCGWSGGSRRNLNEGEMRTLADKVWKARERVIAGKLGTQRVVCSGVRGEGDIISDKYHIDVKHKKKIPFYTEWKKNKKEAATLGKIPLVIIHEKGSRMNLVIIDLDDFIKLTEKEEKDAGM
jgi:hypothetical protein